MSMSNAAEAALLDLLFLNTGWADVGDAVGLLPSTLDGEFFAALHTADPAEAGDQTTSEAAYTSYARVGVTRDAAGFSRATSTMSFVADVLFPAATGGSETLTHWSLGLKTSGASVLLCRGALTNPLAVASGVQPKIPAGTSFAIAD